MANHEDNLSPEMRAAAKEAEMVAAERALARGDFDEARAHLSDAERLGVQAKQIRDLRNSISRAEKGLPTRIRRSFWKGFFLSALCYIILAFRQPTGWTIPVWSALAFLLVPAAAGYLTGRAQGMSARPQDRFRSAMWATAWPMFFYTLLSLIVLRMRVQSGPDAGQLFMIVTLLSFIYAAAAGLVAGLAGSKLAWVASHRRSV